MKDSIAPEQQKHKKTENKQTHNNWVWMLRYYYRVARYNIGSDLFSETTWANNEVIVKKMPSVREPWLVISSLSQKNMKNASIHE